MIRNRKKIVDMIFNFIFHKFPVILERTAFKKGLSISKTLIQKKHELYILRLKLQVTISQSTYA